MKVWKDKAGNKLTGKEFIQRWRKGIEKVTALQQINSQIYGRFVLMIGVFWGIYVSILTAQIWLTAILIGSFMVAKAQMYETYQKKLILEKLEGGVNG